jgi:DNA polymerase-3 subunit delta
MARGPAAQPPSGAPWPEVGRGEPGPLYGLFGEEDFLVGQALEDFFRSPAFAPNPEMNTDRFRAGEDPPSRILESAQTLPFLGSRRLVVVQQAEAWAAAQANELLGYLADPAPTTCLVFAGAKLNRTTKFAKALAKAGKVHLFGRMYPRQIAPWLAQRAKLRHKRLAQPAAQRLAELAGLGLGALDSEVEKLSLFVGQRAEITLDDVREVTGRGRLYGIFDLTDALAAGELARALAAYDQLHSLGEPAVRVLAMVSRLFRQVAQARQVLDTGGGQAEVQQALRTPPSATQTLVQRARREDARALARRLQAVLKADVALKSSAGSDRVVMERLIMEVCTG